jgi:hypothetical protein
MAAQITLTLSPATYRQAETLARDTGRAVVDVLVETIERSLRSGSSRRARAGRA